MKKIISFVLLLVTVCLLGIGSQAAEGDTYAENSSPNVEKVYDGKNVILSVTSQSIPENATYQWYRNGTLIEGETSPSLTVSGEITSNEGDSYRCVVTPATEEDYVFTVKITQPNTKGERNFSGFIIIGLSLGLIVLMSFLQVRKERR